MIEVVVPVLAACGAVQAFRAAIGSLRVSTTTTIVQERSPCLAAAQTLTRNRRPRNPS
jgi:hypothetical protein